MDNFYEDDFYRQFQANAVLAGEKSRILMELKNDKGFQEESHRRSIRHRLATSLVQLGVKLDQIAAEDVDNEEN